MKQIGTCATCKYFERGRWHKCIDPDESEQFGGYCDLLTQVLAITNSVISWQKKLYVQDSFGCIFWTENTEDKK